MKEKPSALLELKKRASDPDRKKLITLNVDEVIISSKQDRSGFDEDKINNLASSIKKQGLISPIDVKELDNGSYKLIAGERRLRAHKLLKKNTIEAILHNNIDEEKSSFIMLIENHGKELLTPLETAKALKSRMVSFGYDVQALSTLVGWSKTKIREYLAILNYPPITQNLANDRIVLTPSHLVKLKSIENSNPEEMSRINSNLRSDNPSLIVDLVKSQSQKEIITNEKLVENQSQKKKIFITEEAFLVLFSKVHRLNKNKFYEKKDLPVLKDKLAKLENDLLADISNEV